jgi:hypothetical protein
VLSRLEALAWLLDSSIPLPVLGYRIGLESLLGLVPLLGDAIGALFSSYILFVAAKLGVPRVTLLRMGFNIAVEAIVGLIPLAGDLFDFAWRANRRNVDLLRAHHEDSTRARRGDWLFFALLLLCLSVIFGLCGWGAIAVFVSLLHA